jgi:chromosome segregation ATPase
MSTDVKRLQRELDEKTNEVELLSQQITVYAGDFGMEREDRERAHGKLAEVNSELEQARHRITQLELENDDRGSGMQYA